jgi:hypothetical protein
MAIRCPQCGAEYDVALFQFGIAFRCECGATVRAEHVEPAPPRPTADPEAVADEEDAYRELQRAADRISFLIVATGYQAIDIQIERRRLRELCRRLFPDKLDLLELIYFERFNRLWEQFRPGEEWPY